MGREVCQHPKIFNYVTYQPYNHVNETLIGPFE